MMLMAVLKAWKQSTQFGSEDDWMFASRHTYRSWLDAVGTGNAVQQKLMRHADTAPR